MLFRCLRSGNTVNIEQPDDIERMKTHEEYVQVSTHSQGDDHGKEATRPQDAQAYPHQDAQAKVLRRPGRPKKG